MSLFKFEDCCFNLLLIDVLMHISDMSLRS